MKRVTRTEHTEASGSGYTVRCVALLRGINVGKAKRVAMADLRALVESLGFSEVTTLLNSGNVVFTAGASDVGMAAGRIEEEMAARLKVASRVSVFTASELAEIIAENPQPERAAVPSRYMVGFLASASDAVKLRPLLEMNWSPEVLSLGRRVVYLWCPDGVIESRLAPAVGKLVEDAVTVRNWSTALKLLALLE